MMASHIYDFTEINIHSITTKCLQIGKCIVKDVVHMNCFLSPFFLRLYQVYPMFFSKNIHELVLCWSNKTICSLINLVKMRKQVPQLKQLFKNGYENSYKFNEQQKQKQKL